MEAILGRISRNIPPSNFKSMKLVCRTARLIDARTLGEIRNSYDLFVELYRREVFSSTDLACLKMLLRAEDLHQQARQVAKYEREAKETLMAALNNGANHQMPSEAELKDCEPVRRGGEVSHPAQAVPRHVSPIPSPTLSNVSSQSRHVVAQETTVSGLPTSPTFLSSDSQWGETIPVSQRRRCQWSQHQGISSIQSRASTMSQRSAEDQFCPACHPKPISRSALPAYNLRPAKGLVMIINMERFSGGPVTLEDRPGSGHDVHRLHNCFRKVLNYTVEVRNNLPRAELLDYLREVASRSHIDTDCLLCFLMSHGCKDSLFTCDGCEVPLTSIIQFFKECRQLDHKPKLFFTQSCRSGGDDGEASATSVQADNVLSTAGSREQVISSPTPQSGVVPSQSRASLSQASTVPSQYSATSTQSSVTSSPSGVMSPQSNLSSAQSSVTSLQSSQPSACDSDILIGYATSPQGSAYRASNRGSVYIEKLCNCIHSLVPRHENLTDILAEVNRKVSKEAKEEYQRVQIPMPMYTLKRRLVFPCPLCRDCKCT